MNDPIWNTTSDLLPCSAVPQQLPYRVPANGTISLFRLSNEEERFFFSCHRWCRVGNLNLLTM